MQFSDNCEKISWDSNTGPQDRLHKAILSVNPFFPTVPTCAVRDTASLGIMPLKPLGDDSVPRALSSLRGLRGVPEVPPSCRETQSLGQQMLERWEKMG